MGTNRGNDKSYLRDEGAVRRAAMMVVDECGENAAAYAVTRAISLPAQLLRQNSLDRLGDETTTAQQPQWPRSAPD